MITLKSASELVKMQAAGKVVGETLKLLGENIRPGVTTAHLNKLAHEYVMSCGATPSFLGYAGYPASVCISVNNQVIHGIPGKRVLRDGDIVSCDFGAILDGFHGDAARTFLCGEVKPELQQLVKVTRECFFEGLKYCRPCSSTPNNTATAWSATMWATASAGRCTRTPRSPTTTPPGRGSASTPAWPSPWSP